MRTVVVLSLSLMLVACSAGTPQEATDLDALRADLHSRLGDAVALPPCTPPGPHDYTKCEPPHDPGDPPEEMPGQAGMGQQGSGGGQGGPNGGGGP